MNRSQFITYVEESQESLRRFLTALCCGDMALADDLAQETLVKAWLACDDFRGDASFSSWIRRIAYNSFVNSRRTVRVLEPIEAAERVSSPEKSDDSFRYQELYSALARLTARERSSIVLFYLEGYSVREIAEIEGVSADSVKQHLSRGRAHLRTLIENNP